jgi:hypothetical protein
MSRIHIPQPEERFGIVDELAHIPELRLRQGLSEDELLELMAKRIAYLRDRDQPTINKAQAKRDRKAAKLAKVFGSKH